LAKFGAKRSAAIPLLMEALQKRDMTAKILAAHGLKQLGPEAAQVIPELLRLLEADQLAVLNDEIVNLFMAIHPNTDLIPKLLQILAEPELLSRGFVSLLISSLANQDAARAEPYRVDLTALLQHDDAEVRLQAACALARYPGPKDSQLVPFLIKALNAPALEDPHYYDPIVDQKSNTTFMRDGEKFKDNIARNAAINALMNLGPAAKPALPQLEIVARVLWRATLPPAVRLLPVLAQGRFEAAPTLWSAALVVLFLPGAESCR
jgi:HEAT repeat protein